jgi:hypothetical protein
MEGIYIKISTECKRRSLSLVETVITERSPDEFQTAWRGWEHHPFFLQSVKRIDRYGLNRSACRAFKILKLYYEKLTACSGTPLAHYDAATDRPINRWLTPAIAQNRCRERTMRQRQGKRN